MEKKEGFLYTRKRRRNDEFSFGGNPAVTWQQLVMYVVGIVLIWLAVKKEYEPSLLLRWDLVQFW